MATLPPSTSGMAKQSPHTAMGFLSSPQASDYLPSISPTVVYSTAQAAWAPQELQALHAGLAQFPADQFDNVTRYIKIAATLPRKCVRDVAFKVKALGYPSGQPAAAVATKRMTIEPYQEPNQAATSTAELEEARLAALLQDNVLAINTMRTNLLNGKADENRAQMIKFRDNCQTVLSALGDISTSIPPLPLQLDTSLLDEDNDGNNNSSNNTTSSKNQP
ncbi:hypothetical protein PF005_g22509 [Phytophthora fragariae]|uniref:Myb-like domain-containing protein n=1 Tax=Phytophthora fragariae TaxID=53985 RepID=A0A6A4CBJ3_9STRA|nr:hypothetical protein PF003_g7159 [Phytophthora fragariae]KAE8926370.1 hypothetical protein PF009_g23437 [Phytophthora fragariae]KAE8983235.1 hypothetical protein PF011_g21278 [Phytophthora fragariae]KAE9081195.1 hypothetical protein PF007_g22761 [Phytophthora fragariae]KAE9085973.1 hypothetical protein PF010_g20266 [Phytophthora fragariae]